MESKTFTRATVELGESIDKFIDEYKYYIDKLKNDLENDIKIGNEKGIATEIDDVFLVRFLLSADSYEEAKNNLAYTIKWRMEKKDVLEKVWNDQHPPHQHIFQRFQLTGWVGTLRDGHPIFVVRVGKSDTKGLMATVTNDIILDYLIYNNELGFQKCIRETRKRRTICKVIGVTDFADFSIFGSRSDNRFFKPLGDASKMSEIIFPQLQGKSVLINAPSTIQIVLSVFRKFQSKRSAEKQTFCPAQNTEKKSAKECPFLQKYGGLDQVPPFLGGTMKCPEYLQVVTEREEQTLKVKIASGKKETIELDVSEQNQTLSYEILVESGVVGLSMEIGGNVLIQERKLGASDGLFQGQVVVSSTGKLQLVFDNTANWTSRSVQYLLSFHSHSDD